MRVWHLARRLVRDIYLISEGRKFRGDGPLRNQIRRAGSSIVSNISEGYARDGNREFIQFLSLAKGSAGEVLGQLYMAYDQQYFDEDVFRQLRTKARLTMAMLDNLMTYLRESSFKGKKFRTLSVVHESD
jgi:four helix bundle protein